MMAKGGCPTKPFSDSLLDVRVPGRSNLGAPLPFFWQATTL